MIYLSTVHSIINFVIRREMVVAQYGVFSEIVVARSGGFRETDVYESLFAHKMHPFRSIVSGLR